MNVFVSHETNDIAIFSALRLAIDAAEQLTCWNNEIPPGAFVANTLKEAINRCDVCVFVATKRSVTSKWCLTELGAFWGAGKKVFIYQGDPELGESDMPRQFKDALFTNDANKLISGIVEEKEPFSPRANQIPGNVFWLGHDLAAALVTAAHPEIVSEVFMEPRHELYIEQSVFHLQEMKPRDDAMRRQLVRAREIILTADAPQEDRKEAVGLIKRSITDLGTRIQNIQEGFRAGPSGITEKAALFDIE